MHNLYQQFRALLPEPPLQAGTVIEAADDIVTVQLPGGGLVIARSPLAGITVGQQVFVRDGVIEGPAPNLALEVIEI